jgi:hypothetical protein
MDKCRCAAKTRTGKVRAVVVEVRMIQEIEPIQADLKSECFREFEGFR